MDINFRFLDIRLNLLFKNNLQHIKKKTFKKEI